MPLSNSRLLLVSRYCYLDDSSGAAVASRSLLKALVGWGMRCEVLCGGILDFDREVDLLDWLTNQKSFRADAIERLGEPASSFRVEHDGVSVTICSGTSTRPHRPDDSERLGFLAHFDAVSERFGPDFVLTYGGDKITEEVMARCRSSGVAAIFALHNTNYHHESHFDAASRIVTPSRYAAEHYRATLGLDCEVLPSPVDAARARAERVAPGYVTFVNPSHEKGVFAFARIADELGRRRPDIPFLVVESRGTEETLAACGLDLRPHGNISLMGITADPRNFWGVTRICLMPSLCDEVQGLAAVEAMGNGIPVIASSRGALPETLGDAGIVLPLPVRLTPGTRLLPTAEEAAPWVEAIIRLWDDADFHERHSRLASSEARRWTPEVLRPRYERFFAAIGSPRVGPEAARRTQGLEGKPRLDGLEARPPALSIEAGIAAIGRRWPGLKSTSDDDPIFVLSAGWRSGSTMLQRLIVRNCFLWGEPFGHSWLIDSLAAPLRCFSDQWPEPHHFHKGADADALSKKFIANLNPPVSELLRAHQAYFDQLFARPARREGAKRWGFKEVRLGVDHAIYLKWLFPRSKFLLLIRDPYDAWKSYAARAAKGWRWFDRWPDKPVTARSFAEHWRDLTTSFLDDHAKVDGLVVRYEALKAGDYAAIEEYLGFPLSREAGEVNPSDGGPPPIREIAEADRAILDDRLGVLAGSLGYHRYRSPTNGRSEGDQPMTTANPVLARSASVLRSEGGDRAGSLRNIGPVRVGSLDATRCVILVPVGHHIEPACDDALRSLERRGYAVRRVRGYSAIDQGRNQISTNALADGFEELMWIDSDIAFEPDAIDRLRSHNLPISCAVYPKKGKHAFASNFSGATKQVVFGKRGELVEIPYAGAGFLHTRREVYEAVRDHYRLPACNERFGRPMIPFFQPMVVPDGAGHWYLAEDFAFCHRVRECGYQIMADTTIRLKHIGSYLYSWEDAGGERDRFANFTFNIKES